MIEQINILRENGEKKLNSITSSEQLQEWYQQYLGRKGDLLRY